ncbi:hypothetical protein LG651_05580 [Tamlana sp. 62-3]|uniref:Uncharacterized protein n=1 Tax=Neotamlana sargassicola TaxID=2883125 RepID=A0A9X1I590_9FLAO|nr:hypothetical protein [Tamlana sargassicola]MCB4807713.1 hypothetical protein [Tamlana sargassicola]
MLGFQSLAFAHNPYQSSLKLHVLEHEGWLAISLSQYGIEQALVKKYPELDLKAVDLTEFKELLIKYLRETIAISINGEALKIGKGAIKLGNHQSDLKFKINYLPANPNIIKVTAPCFEENQNQINFFQIVYKDSHVREKLTKDNAFSASFLIENNTVAVFSESDSENFYNNYILWVSLAIVAIAILIFVFKRKNKTTA